MDEETIRNQLRNGKTIDEVCTEHQLTFKQLIKIMKTYDNPLRTSGKGMAYLYRMPNGHYTITKKSTHYGTYKTLRDAQKIRDWMVRHGWSKKQLDLACDWCGVERCRR